MMLTFISNPTKLHTIPTALMPSVVVLFSGVVGWYLRTRSTRLGSAGMVAGERSLFMVRYN